MTASVPRVGEIQAVTVEAVEAAKRAYISLWASKFYVSPEEYSRAVLEAAAPHMHAYLLAELRDRDEKLAKVEALHTRAFKPVETWAKGYRFTGEHCAFDGEHWPCATIAAVAAANGGGE